MVRTVEQFAKVEEVDEIIVVTQKKDFKKYQKILKKEGLKVKLIEGGPERIISCFNGVRVAEGNFVITHDGARPLTPAGIIKDLISATKKYGAAMTAIRPTATVKYAPKNLIVKKTLPRVSTWIAQTPQGFKKELIFHALETAIRNKNFAATDDSEFVTKIGLPVKIVPGDPTNIKVTHPLDLTLANQLFKLSKR